MYKPKVLWVGEATYLNTGFSVYGREILSRLYKLNMFELAEFASYGNYKDAINVGIPWKFYPNLPAENDKEEQQKYMSLPTNAFGEWRFEDVCLDFEPDIVISITDPWMHEYQFQSPYRRLYKHVVMPTIDSDPQQPGWIAMYLDADKVATYSTYGKRILEEQTKGRLKVSGVLRPGFDENNFKVLPDKEEVRQELLMPVPADSFIVGTVMRNQKRKLFDDLFMSFKDFCNRYPELSEKTFLYCHTSWPDQGWNIPRLLKEHGLANKVLFTYVCQNCRNILSSFFNNTLKMCPFCGGPMLMPNTRKGADNAQLGKIYNSMDVYVQYSIAEGAGMPPVEAAACGIPILEVDFSAMEDYVRCLQGVPLKILKRFRESETHCYRVYGDNEHLIEELYKVATMPSIDRHAWALKTKALANKHFSWDDISRKWVQLLMSTDVTESIWKIPPFIHQPQQINTEQNMGNSQFVDTTIAKITGRTDLINTYFAAQILRDLSAMAKIQGFGSNLTYNDNSMFSQQFTFKPYGRQDVVNDLLEKVNKTNYWENKRWQKINGQYQKPNWMM